MNLNGKTVVITGASRGLGKALAEIIAKENTNLVLSARSGKELSELAHALKASPFVADIADEKCVAELADFSVNKYGKIDVWINNAGIWLPHGPITDLNFDRVHAMFEVNVFGLMYGSKAALKIMQKQKNGAIVNILSTSALEGRLYSAGYCASKFAARGFTDSLRPEAELCGVKVIGVYPGGMKTSLFDESRPSGFENFFDPSHIAELIVVNLKSEKPEESLVLKRQI